MKSSFLFPRIVAVFSILLSSFFMSSCIKDDVVDDYVNPEIRITSITDSLAIDSTFQSSALYFNNVGEQVEVEVVWTSSNDSVANITNSGLIKGVGIGTCTIYSKYVNGEVEITDSFLIAVSVKVTVMVVTLEKSGTVATTSSYPVSGSYTLEVQGDDLLLTFNADYSADNSLPGLYIFLANNNSTTAGALEIGLVTVFNGVHSYLIPNTGINDYGFILYFCKPFNVKVGQGIIPPN